MTRQEREKVVLDLYHNQGKNIREIAKEARMSFRDISTILNRAAEEKEEQQRKEGRQQGIILEQQRQQLSVSTQAYKLFSEDKTPSSLSVHSDLEL